MSHRPRYLDTISAFFVAVLLISNVASSKILDLGPLTFDGGTLLFPLSYIFGDVLTEVYGFARARKVIWLGFATTALMAVTFLIVGALPPARTWPHQDAYDAILGQTPRIVLASLVAYWAGEFSNSAVLARLKVLTGGRWLWTRTIGSTLVGQGVDTGLFIGVAFGGVYDGETLEILFASNYIFKCFVEAAFTPVTYYVTGFLKKSEQIDHFDRGTRFTPFSLKSPES